MTKPSWPSQKAREGRIGDAVMHPNAVDSEHGSQGNRESTNTVQNGMPTGGGIAPSEIITQMLANRTPEMSDQALAVFEDVVRATKLDEALIGKAGQTITNLLGAWTATMWPHEKNTVATYLYCGVVFNRVRKLMPRKEYREFVKNYVRVAGVGAETVRQMRKIADCGPGILKYGKLGVRRCLELLYMLRTMEERIDATGNEITVAQRLDEIERDNPFPMTIAHDDSAVVEFRTHMDSIITKYRLDKHLPDGVCTFSRAERIARGKCFAISPGEAKLIAAMIEPVTDKGAWLDEWIDAGMVLKRPQAGATPMDPSRISELLSLIVQWREQNAQMNDNILGILRSENTSIVLYQAQRILEDITRAANNNTNDEGAE